MKQITGGITAAKGFQAAGIEAGIKYQNRKDMAIIYSEKPCVAAGTFTSNVVKAAPVKWDRKLLEESPYVQAVIVNTGIANAGTGAEGMKLCEGGLQGAWHSGKCRTRRIHRCHRGAAPHRPDQGRNQQTCRG